MDASQILVIILATTLAVFLVLAIVLVAILIKVARQIQKVTSSVERSANGFESIICNLQKAVAPAVVSRFVMEQIERFSERQRKRDKSDK